MTLLVALQAQAEVDEVALLKEQLEALQQRLEDLERRLDGSGRTPAQSMRTPESRFETELLDQAVTGAERVEEAQVAAIDEPAPIRFGGALRFNHFLREDVSDSRTRRGDSGFDLFRLNVDGEIREIILSAEYRYSPSMDVIRHGWIGYRFADDSMVKLGIHRVPFGLLPFASHNFWDGVPFYAGFSDNHDLGVAYQRSDGPWDFHLAFYKNEELGSAGTLARYAPDVVRQGEQQNEEINRFNARAAYTLGRDTGCEHELGVSGQRADLVNATTDSRGNHWALAGHLDSRCGRWNLQIQGIRYVYDPDNPAGVSNDSVRLGAFGTSFDLAARGKLAVANLAYNFALRDSWLDQVICYNNYSRLFKDVGAGRDSELNTVGCGIGAGPLFAYVDLIFARNMLFFGDGSMADSDDDRWRGRLNINLGYYW
ncbi:MAG: hypothetical protein JJT88_19920 [Gammaproteobacteria bacterium]|nr:hypothetical protein [Gammaproteobacteria bacterium]